MSHTSQLLEALLVILALSASIAVFSLRERHRRSKLTPNQKAQEDETARKDGFFW